MKKKDIGLGVGILVLAAVLLLVYQFLIPDQTNASLQITVYGEVYGVYALKEDQTIQINDTNTCRIKDGVVTMTEADCPDHLCEKQKPIDGKGGTIVCLPNRVVLSIIQSNQPEIDVISS